MPDSRLEIWISNKDPNLVMSEDILHELSDTDRQNKAVIRKMENKNLIPEKQDDRENRNPNQQ